MNRGRFEALRKTTITLFPLASGFILIMVSFLHNLLSSISERSIPATTCFLIENSFVSAAYQIPLAGMFLLNPYCRLNINRTIKLDRQQMPQTEFFPFNPLTFFRSFN